MSKNYVHQKRKGKGKNGKKSQQYQNGGNGGNGAFRAQGRSNQDQRNGDFSFDTIHGLKLKEVAYTVPPISERKQRRSEFQGIRGPDGEVVVEGVRSKFLKMLAKEHEKELVERLGLTEKDLEGMRDGYVPNGFNVHHKLAIHGGGKNEFSNFILTPLYPHDQWHHDVMDPQISGIRDGETRTIQLPWTDEMIYDPKQFGFTKENQPVKPNYTSNVNPTNYPDLYKPEHISVAKRQKDMAAFYASIDAKGNNEPKKAAPREQKAEKMARRVVMNRQKTRA